MHFRQLCADSFVLLVSSYNVSFDALCVTDCFARLQYEPELFPGLIYRMLVPKVVLLIFVSGKVVLTGMLFWKAQKSCILVDDLCQVLIKVCFECHFGLILWFDCLLLP